MNLYVYSAYLERDSSHIESVSSMPVSLSHIPILVYIQGSRPCSKSSYIIEIGLL